MFSISSIHRQYYLKSLLIFSFLLLAVALVTTWNAPATGYEASIYWSTPLIFWVSVVSSVIVGIALIVLLAPCPTSDGDPLWKLGLLLVFLCYTITLGLFVIRGYYMWCMAGDPASHIGWIKEILTAGHAPHLLLYPITHIYVSEIILITGLDLVFLHKVIPLIFALLCVVFMYILVRTITTNQIAAVLAAVISCTLNYGSYLGLMPNGLSNLLIPLTLFLMFQFLKQKETSWGILLVTTVVLFPVFHPVPAIFVGLVFLTLWIPTKLLDFHYTFREKQVGLLELIKFDIKLVIPLLLLLIWFIFWISSFSTWDYTIKNAYLTICSEGESSKLTDLVDQMSYAQGYGYNVVEQILKQMGGPIILGVLSIMSFPLLWKALSESREEECIFSLYGPLSLLCIIIPVLYMFNFTFGPLRLVAYLSILGTIFAAYFLFRYISRSRNENNFVKSWSSSLFIIMLLVGLFLFGLLNLYPSPYNLTPNYQTTRAEIVGMANFYEHRDVDVPISRVYAAPERFADALLTPEEKAIQNSRNIISYGEQSRIPWHFGYDAYPSISLAYGEETDLILLHKDKVVYADYFPKMAQYRLNFQDFDRLAKDRGVNLIYSNGNFDTWKITP